MDEAQAGPAARAAATAASTSAVVASFRSATASPVAGLITRWVSPCVATGRPLIQLLGTLTLPTLSNRRPDIHRFHRQICAIHAYSSIIVAKYDGIRA
ncbi:Uncharacterised protein [Mycobacteroides abscessus subsp. abscessus]|nr:Uncharacterised protein [Mycobacteroides abscessus subsp. abscessus]